MPARNEGKSIGRVIDHTISSVTVPFELVVVVDADGDPTVAHVARAAGADTRVRCVVNEFGPGPANAIRHGFEIAGASVVVVMMADGSDDARLVDDLVHLVERGVVIAAASRYMPGGQQVGGPWTKAVLSRAAGLSLHLLCRVGTRDATNSFKAYDGAFVRGVGIHSDTGFELGLELTAKARRLRLPVAELPTIWLERAEGISNFQVAAWIPRYLRWYRYAFGPRLTVSEMREGLDG